MKLHELRALRKEAGFRTQAALAEVLGMGWNEGIVGAIEAGTVGIDEETCELIKTRIREHTGQPGRREEALA